jgi:transposase-like protein
VLVELRVVEQRYKAVLEVLDGAWVTEVAHRYGVVRRTVHDWLRRHAAGGMAALADRSSRPDTCPHQMPPAVEARLSTCVCLIRAGAAHVGAPARCRGGGAAAGTVVGVSGVDPPRADRPEAPRASPVGLPALSSCGHREADDEPTDWVAIHREVFVNTFYEVLGEVERAYADDTAQHPESDAPQRRALWEEGDRR